MMTRIKFLTFIIILMKAVYLYSASPLTVRIEQPISKDFPDMKVFITVTDRKGEPVKGLIRHSFTALVDGQSPESKMVATGFQYSEEGISYSLMLSVSGLMEGHPIDQQIKAATSLLEEMRKQDELSVYIFAEETKAVFEFQKKSEELFKKISKIKIIGGNPHLRDAIVHVARRIKQSKLDRKVVILFSDGRDSGSRYTKKQLHNILNENNFPIYSLGIVLMSGQNLYRIARLSSFTGGLYLNARKLTRFPMMIKKMTDQIKHGYILNFEVNNINADNKLHQLQVNVLHKKRKAHFTKNFLAIKIPTPLWLKIVFIVLSVIAIVLLVFLFIIFRRASRKQMGITKRKCPVCKHRMKDDWDECLFCKYLPWTKRMVKRKEKLDKAETAKA